MIGWDFSTFWEVGRAVLSGGNPYAVEISRYPPIAAIAFAIFGVLPFMPSFAIWTGVNIILCLSFFKRLKLQRPSWAWLAFSPIIFNIVTGQLDLFFMWLAVFLPRKDWKSIAAAVLLTMKPQIALVVLPWQFVRWLKSDRKLILWWGAGTIVFQLLPIVLSPSLFQGWMDSLKGLTEFRIGYSSGIFSLSAIGFPIWLAGIIGAGIAIWGLFQDEMICRAAQLIANPTTIWYDDVFLTGGVPALILIPYSVLAFLASTLIQNSIALATIPLMVIVYRLVEQRRSRQALARGAHG